MCVDSCMKSSRSANVNEINLDSKRTNTLSPSLTFAVVHYEHREIFSNSFARLSFSLSLFLRIVLHRWVSSFTSAFDSPSSRDHVCESEYMLATRSVASHVHISLLFVPENRNLWSPFHFIFVFHQEKKNSQLNVWRVLSMWSRETRNRFNSTWHCDLHFVLGTKRKIVCDKFV